MPHTAQIALRLSSHATDRKKILPPVWDSVSYKSDGTITSTSSMEYYSLQLLADWKEIRAATHFLVHIKDNMSSFSVENMLIMFCPPTRQLK